MQTQTCISKKRELFLKRFDEQNFSEKFDRVDFERGWILIAGGF